MKKKNGTKNYISFDIKKNQEKWSRKERENCCFRVNRAKRRSNAWNKQSTFLPSSSVFTVLGSSKCNLFCFSVYLQRKKKIPQDKKSASQSIVVYRVSFRLELLSVTRKNTNYIVIQILLFILTKKQKQESETVQHFLFLSRARSTCLFCFAPRKLC